VEYNKIIASMQADAEKVNTCTTLPPKKWLKIYKL
jgi:hypothetical protein